MKIFFTCPTSTLSLNYKKYKDWLNFIKKQGHTIEDDWVDAANENIKKKVLGDTDKYYAEKLKAISDADAIIAEGSIKSYGVAHQITMAINKSKPVLLLLSSEGESQINSTGYVEAIKSEWLTQKQYSSEEEAKEIIQEFIKTFKTGKKVRFHLVISQNENKQLEKLMTKESKTKTEIIRELIRKSDKSG